jgi:hypothetical protein
MNRSEFLLFIGTNHHLDTYFTSLYPNLSRFLSINLEPVRFTLIFTDLIINSGTLYENRL